MRTRLLKILALITVLGVADQSIQAAAPATPQGVITAREFLDTGASVALSSLTNSVKFPNSPDVVAYPNLFEWPANSDGSPPASDVKNNYGVQIIGYLYPPTTGNYVFAIASDDNGVLYLSTDDTPLNKVQIAAESSWNPVRAFAAETRRTRLDVGTATERLDNTSKPIPLTAGKAYYIEALMKEAGGGDNLAVAWQPPGAQAIQDGDAPIPGSALSSFDKASGAVSIATHPANVTVGELMSATFSVVANGTPPFAFQWTKNNADILDATGSVYTVTSAALSDNGAQFRAKVTGAQGNVTSNPGVLTVTPDTTGPTLANVSAGLTFTEVTVVFSEAVAAASAGSTANYALDGGLTVSAATVVSATTVKLTTSRQAVTTVYTLTVNNVKDTAVAGNTIAANSKKSFSSFGTVRGGLTLEIFNDIGGTPVQGLLDDPKYQSNTPDFVGYVSQFTSRLVLPDNAQGLATRDNYGGRMSGWIAPTESAQYEFFIRSDDASQLFLSSDADPAKATQIAEEAGCCGPFEEPGATETSAPISLTAGSRYYIMALWKEGGGGDYCDVAWRKVGDTAVPRALPYISGAVLETLAVPETFTPPTVAFATPAAGSNIDTGVPVTLTANATAAGSKTIVRVDYLEQGRVIGSATASPFALVLGGLSADAHVFTARATDSAGIYTDSVPLSISVGAQVEKQTLLAIDDKTTWRYDRTGRDLGTAWREKSYDDSAWPQGKALIADESTTTVEPIRTAISRFNDASEYVQTFYFRTHFNFNSAVSSSVKLQLRHVVDDGAVIYLNGVEINRLGIAAGVTYDFLTSFGGHENAWEGPFDIPIASLVQGDNVLAAEVHQSGGGSSDMVFGAELVASVPVVPIVAELVKIDDKTTWRYDRTGRDLGTAWLANNYDDSAWPQGKTLIADESTTTVEPIRTAVSRFNDASEYVQTFYFRTHFTFPAASTAGAKLKLRHVVDDGVVIYLNGVEINRLGLAAGVTFDFLTSFGGHENAWEGPFDIPVDNLRVGDNVLAAEVHQSGTGSSDMVFGVELIATYFGTGGIGPTEPPKFTKISRSGADVVFEWTGGGTLQAADGVTGPWADVAGASSPRTVTAPAGNKFYRIKK